MTQSSSLARLNGDRPNQPANQGRIDEAVAEILAHRAVIDQAKGMLSVIYDIDDREAFDVLRWRSQTTNTKLRALAEQLIVDFRSVHASPRLPPKSIYDDLLLTAHERVAQPRDRSAMRAHAG
jgi:hypothetical protein